MNRGRVQDAERADAGVNDDDECWVESSRSRDVSAGDRCIAKRFHY